MNRRVLIVLALFVVLNAAFLLFRHWQFSSVVNRANAEENQRISHWIASRVVTGVSRSFSMIGDLVANPYWTKTLPLAEKQKDAIRMLDKIVSESRYRSMTADAEPYDGPSQVRMVLYKRHKKRTKDAIRQAQCFVMLCLLTPEQSALVAQRSLKANGVSMLNNDTIALAEQIEFNETQKARLAEVNAKFLREHAPKIRLAMSPDQGKSKEYYRWTDDWSRRYNAAIWDLLTKGQREKWSQLTASRSLDGPPDLRPTPASDAEAARIDREGLSPTFRALDQNADRLGLDADQKALFNDLKEVARQGLVWLALRKNGGGPQTRADVLHHAEQVALLGILTEQQADKLEATLKNN